MAARLDQPSLSGLELGDGIVQRSDTAKYRTALRRARNVYGLVGGGVRSRPGLRWVGETYDGDQPARLIPWKFSQSQSYVLELTWGRMRFIQDGGYVVERELEVTGATRTDPLVVTVPGHGYAVGDDVVFEGIQGMTELNGRKLIVAAVPTPDTLRFSVDARSWGEFVGATGGVPGPTNPPPPPTPVPAPGDPPPPPPPFEEEEDPPPVVYGSTPTGGGATGGGDGGGGFDRDYMDREEF